MKESNTQEPVGGMKPKPVKERDNLDLLELVCQLNSRAAIYYHNKEMHDAYVEARNEMESRLTAPPAPIKTEGEDEKKVKSNWPDEVRLKMIEKSEFYQEPQIYQYGFYDGYQLAKVEPPSPVGIDVEALNIILDMFEIFMPKEVALDDRKQMAMYEAFHRIKKIKAGYSASLPQSSTGGLPKLDQPILDEEDVKGIIDTQSSTEEEKDLWKTSLNFFQGEYILKPFTTKEEIITELMSTYKISKR